MTRRSIRAIRRHFHKRDPILFPVISEMPLELLEKETDPSRYFSRLCREIIAQQLGGRAAEAIVGRFGELFGGTGPTPKAVMRRPEKILRGAGMSWAKARSLRDLAEKVETRELWLTRLSEMDDETAIRELTKVKGIGRWTAEMFLIFTLGREDVFSYGDLGLRKGLAAIYGARRAETEAQIASITSRWAPYRSYGALAVWHVADSRKA